MSLSEAGKSSIAENTAQIMGFSECARQIALMASVALSNGHDSGELQRALNSVLFCHRNIADLSERITYQLRDQSVV